MIFAYIILAVLLAVWAIQILSDIVAQASSDARFARCLREISSKPVEPVEQTPEDIAANEAALREFNRRGSFFA